MKRTPFVLPLLCLVGLILGCSGSQDDPKALPPGFVSKITGKAEIQTTTNAWLTLSIYNGTEWNLTDIDVVLENKKTQTQRVFRFEITTTEVKKNDKAQVIGTAKNKSPIRPFSETSFEGYIGDFLRGATGQDEWSWTISGVRGFK